MFSASNALLPETFRGSCDDNEVLQMHLVFASVRRIRGGKTERKKSKARRRKRAGRMERWREGRRHSARIPNTGG